ncbi:MAG: cobalamin biosynthesis protein CobG [Pseudomonadota bacterium]
MSDAPKGWCPSAWRPMAVEDGLLLRLRPPMGRLTAGQAAGIADIARQFGNGALDVTNRANLQIRGLQADEHDKVLDALLDLALLDPDAEFEKRRSFMVTPFWQPGDDTHILAQRLTAHLGDLPDLPAKFGFAIDLGPRPVLGAYPADIRFERGQGGIVLRADGAARGKLIRPGDAVTEGIALARWFAFRRTDDRRRMAQVVDAEGGPPGAELAPLPPTAPDGSSLVKTADDGRISADAFARTIETSGAPAIRLTPWRAIVDERTIRSPCPKTAA